MNLSVVVATHNRGVLLRRLLGTLAGQTLAPERFEAVVVDDGSTPPAAEALEGLSTPFDLTLVRQSNAGPASARHRGIGAARGDIVVIIDDDMELGPEFLSRHLEAHEGERRWSWATSCRPPASGRCRSSSGSTPGS